MKLTKKIALIAGIFIHATGSLYASSSAWIAAFQRFGGNMDDTAAAAQTVLANPTSLTLNNALKIAMSLGTPEAYAVAAYRTSGSTKAFAGKVGNYTNVDVTQAAHAIIADAQSRAVVTEPTAPIATPSIPSNSSNSGWGWFGGTSSSAAQQSNITAADVNTAVEAQLKKDILVAAQSNNMLANIVSSGKTGLGLYTAFIDYIFNTIQQAVSSITDAPTQQKVISYMQSKVNTMKASANTNSYKSRTLGRMSSKSVHRKK